ncbi:SUKH-3 domain-containing protein [Glycomyces sp. NPDC048151]|uniref:SUKH-3 domain-containing protein n=1 Tax=Glycomyces sp. NPDC048151 TaxID=3364002 RepID=UPI003710B0A0
MLIDFGPLWANEYVRAALQMSGWDPDRRVDPSATIDRLVAEGFTCNPYAVEILQRFHGIKIDREEPKVPGAKYGRSRIAFLPYGDPIDLLELVNNVGESIGASIFPIADADDGLGLILVGDDGQIYDSRQGQLHRDGATFTEALIRMITRYDYPDFLGGSLPPWWITKGLAKPKPIQRKE